MAQIQSQPFVPQLRQAVQDKHLQPAEGVALQPHVDALNLNRQDKALLEKVLSLVEDKTESRPRWFGNDVLEPKEWTKANQILAKISDPALAQKVSRVLSGMLVEPLDRNQVEGLARSKVDAPVFKFINQQEASKWHTTQYSDYEAKYGEGTYPNDYQNKEQFSGERRALLDQAASSCGPTCTLMLLKANGLEGEIDSIGEIRKVMNGIDSSVRVDKRGIDPEPIAKTLNQVSKGKLEASVHRAHKEGLQNAAQMIDRMQTDLDAGKQVILLSQYMDGNPDSHQGTGHYTVVTEIDAAGNLTLADPYYDNASREMPFAEYESEFNHRIKLHGRGSWEYPNAYVSVANK